MNEMMAFFELVRKFTRSEKNQKVNGVFYIVLFLLVWALVTLYATSFFTQLTNSVLAGFFAGFLVTLTSCYLLFFALTRGG